MSRTMPDMAQTTPNRLRSSVFHIFSSRQRCISWLWAACSSRRMWACASGTSSSVVRPRTMIRHPPPPPNGESEWRIAARLQNAQPCAARRRRTARRARALTPPAYSPLSVSHVEARQVGRPRGWRRQQNSPPNVHLLSMSLNFQKHATRAVSVKRCIVTDPDPFISESHSHHGSPNVEECAQQPACEGVGGRKTPCTPKRAGSLAPVLNMPIRRHPLSRHNHKNEPWPR
eukprot:6176814-Pleurochrysis_carterae.AAC.3